jgi:hypothetical protein
MFEERLQLECPDFVCKESQKKKSMGYRDDVRVEGVPRKEYLEEHPGWWCFPDEYWIRGRRAEDQRKRDPRR